jgi:hypothetical protein
MSNNFSYLTKTIPDIGKYDDVRNYACILIDCYTEVQNVGTVDTLTVFFSVNKLDEIFRQTYTVTGYRQIIIVPVYPYYKLDITTPVDAGRDPSIKRFYTSFYSVNPIPSLMNGENGNSNGRLVNNAVSVLNSSTALLGPNAIFTGIAESVYSYKEISVYVISNVASAVNGLSVEFSSDGINWDFKTTSSISANTFATTRYNVCAQYFRIVYTNGGTIQASFRLQTIYFAN